jgi:hypothetical protein
MSDVDGADDRRGAIRQAEENSESPPRENDKKAERRRQHREFAARIRLATKQQLEELVRLQAVQAVVIPALRGRIVGLETSEAALQSLLTAKV